MALITSVTLPVAYIMMRKLLAAQYSWDEVGIWQGVSSISDAYLQFITASFSVYFITTMITGPSVPVSPLMTAQFLHRIVLSPFRTRTVSG